MPAVRLSVINREQCDVIGMVTSGRLGMIICPMLEDEAIYSLETDGEKKRIFLVDTPFTETIVPKLKQHNVPYTRICEEECLAGNVVPHDGYSVIIWTMSMGLHAEPSLLKLEVCDRIIKMMGVVDSIMLYYGRCGKAMDDIDQWAKEYSTVPITIFRNKDGTICDDCICVPIGGTDRYLSLLRKYPGRIYFTPAMASNFDGFLKSLELFNGIDVDNKEIMKMLLDMAGYTTVLEIQTGLGDQAHFHENTVKFAEEYGLKVLPLGQEWPKKDLTDANYRHAKETMVQYLARKEGVKV